MENCTLAVVVERDMHKFLVFLEEVIPNLDSNLHLNSKKITICLDLSA